MLPGQFSSPLLETSLFLNSSSVRLSHLMGHLLLPHHCPGPEMLWNLPKEAAGDKARERRALSVSFWQLPTVTDLLSLLQPVAGSTPPPGSDSARGSSRGFNPNWPPAGLKHG